MANQLTDQSTMLLNSSALIHLQDDILYTTSVEVANAFGKRHDDVLRKIRLLECSEAYHLRNFTEVIREVPGAKGSTREMPMYQLTKNGFMFLVMGFSGKKAARIKEAYIEAFDMMYEALFIKPKPIQHIAISDADIVNSHALDVHLGIIFRDWKTIGPALQQLGYPKYADLNQHIQVASMLAKGLNLKNRLD